MFKNKKSPTSGDMGLQSDLSIQKIPGISPLSFDDIVKHSHPQYGLDDKVNIYRTKNLDNIQRGLRKIRFAQEHDIPTMYGVLHFTIVRGGGEVIDLGIVSTRVVTTAGVTAVVDALRNNDVTTIANFKYHALGTGTTAEASGDTALESELTASLYVGDVRATGTQAINGATVYQSVATITLDSGTPAVTEHGLLSAATGGTLLDRSVFAAVNLVGANGDAIAATYELTVAAGG